jgi:hypothetical protein
MAAEARDWPRLLLPIPLTPRGLRCSALCRFRIRDRIRNSHPIPSLEKDMSVQALLREALNDLFGKYGRSRIA